jgi:hypothetical protein
MLMALPMHTSTLTHPPASFSPATFDTVLSLCVTLDTDVLRDEIQCDVLWLYLGPVVDEMGIQVTRPNTYE